MEVLKPICKKMSMETKLHSLIEKNQIEDNSQAYILYNVIKKHLPLNYF